MTWVYMMEMSKNKDLIIGRHVYGSLYYVDKELLGDRKRLEQIVLEAVKVANAKLLDMKSWNVAGDKGGVSVVAIVEESHIALHTWIEYSYATLDVYTCGETADPWKAFDYIVSELKPKVYTRHYADRSQLPIQESEG